MATTKPIPTTQEWALLRFEGIVNSFIRKPNAVTLSAVLSGADLARSHNASEDEIRFYALRAVTNVGNRNPEKADMIRWWFSKKD